MVKRGEFFYQNLIIVPSIQSAPIVIIGEHVTVLIEKFVSEITIPQFTENGAAYLTSFEANDLYFCFILEVIGVQLVIYDPSQVNSDVYISLFDGQVFGEVT
jgi:hypothetical protein